MCKFNFLAVALMSLVLAAIALADVPQMINYQGRLMNNEGEPIDTSVSMVFTIYDDSIGTGTIWTEPHATVTVIEGLFNVILGATVPINDNVFSDSARWMGITVGTDPEISPRSRLITAAYAFRVSTVDRATGGNISSKVTIGTGHTNSGEAAFVAGQDNTASGDYSTTGGGQSNEVSGNYSTVDGGKDNIVAGNYSVVGGGQNNSTGGYYNTVSGGSQNRTAGLHSSIAGGQQNRVQGDYSFTVGFADTISGTGDYSVLFGINSDLTEDSTFMVDMPHVRIGNETDGYELPAEDGANGDIMVTDGAGQVDWSSVTSVTDGNWIVVNNDMYSAVSGNVGVGTTSPVAKLEISSVLRLTPDDFPGICDESKKGSIYYDESKNEPCYCNGLAWMQMDGGGPCSDECIDGDLDGYDGCDPSNPNDTDGLPADCDDNNGQINPGMSEVCTGGDDDDCDGFVDCNDSDCYCMDGDDDGYGDPAGPCCPYPEYDCDDSNGDIHPGADELCDELDNDCDGQIDEGLGLGDPCTVGVGECERSGIIVCSGGEAVCNATPGTPVTEICDDLLDNDCDDLIDCDDPDCGCATETNCSDGIDNDNDTFTDCDDSDCPDLTWYADSDGDGYGDPGVTLLQCNQPTGYVSNNTDCDDTDEDVNPGEYEEPGLNCNDEVDNDCNGHTDCDDEGCSEDEACLK